MASTLGCQTKARIGRTELSPFKTDQHAETADAVALWRCIAGHRADEPADGAALRRLAEHVTPAMAAAAAGTTTGLDESALRSSRLLNRFRRHAALNALGLLGEGGIPALPLKGLASALWLYGNADDRAIGDADLLVRAGDLDRAIGALERAGFAFVLLPTRSRWGFIGDASFQPLRAADGSLHLDLHVEGDAWPFARALPAEAIFRAATEHAGVRLPNPTHCYLIAASHAARDLFAVEALKGVIDGLLMLREPGRIDWREVTERAAAGNMVRGVASFTALLGRLGAETAPARRAGLPVGRVDGPTFERVVAEHLALFRHGTALPTMTRLAREWRLGAAPAVALRRAGLRLGGLLRPDAGLPRRRDQRQY